MRHKKFRQVDRQTGEPVGTEFVALVVPKRQNGFRQGWVAMAQTPLDLLADDPHISGEELRVLLKILSRLDFNNLLVLNQAELARQMGLHRQAVQRGIKRLISRNVVHEGPRIGISRSYRLNPNFGWKGSSKGHVIALNDGGRKHLKAIQSGERRQDEAKKDQGIESPPEAAPQEVV